MTSATGLLKGLTHVGRTLLSPSYLRDEDLFINGQKISCYVIKGKTKYRGGSPDVVSSLTLWVDKEKLVIRKQVLHQEGAVMMYDSQSYISDQTDLYTVMDLANPGVPHDFFSFNPPAKAQLVHAFSDPYHPKDALMGSRAPDLTFHDANGKTVSLKDFRGKPVLLDFWGTWCSPCVAAMEHLKKLHEETREKGLVILNIDEEDDAEAGTMFFAKRGLDWPNFHDSDGEIWRSLRGNGGVPFYVLINPEGQIVYSKSGASDPDLRTAMARVGIDIPVKDAAADSKPKE